MKSEQSPSYGHLKRVVAFGPRPIGAASNLAAGEYIRGVFAGCGLDVEMEPYDCPYWEKGTAELECNGQKLAIFANPYSPNCDLRARTAACGTLAELQAAELAGKILLVHGVLATQMITPEYVIYAQGPDPLAERIKSKKPAAVIALEGNPNNLFIFLEDWSFPIPNARVHADAGRVLMQNLGTEVHLYLNSHTSQSRTANVVARQPGQIEKRIVVCAHFDTTFDTPGALDNASGSAVLLTLAQRFAGQRTNCALEWVAFSGEDSGGVDFFPYAGAHPDFENICAAINIDGVADWLGTITLTMLGENAEIQAAAQALVSENPDLAWVEPWYESDHSAFFFRGVPALAFSSKGWPHGTMHRPGDTAEVIDPAKLERAVDLVEALVRKIDAGG